MRLKGSCDQNTATLTETPTIFPGRVSVSSARSSTGSATCSRTCSALRPTRGRSIFEHVRAVGADQPFPLRAFYPPVYPGDRDWRSTPGAATSISLTNTTTGAHGPSWGASTWLRWCKQAPTKPDGAWSALRRPTTRATEPVGIQRADPWPVRARDGSSGPGMVGRDVPLRQGLCGFSRGSGLGRPTRGAGRAEVERPGGRWPAPICWVGAGHLRSSEAATCRC